MYRKNILMKILLKVYKYRFFGGLNVVPCKNPAITQARITAPVPCRNFPVQAGPEP